MYIPASSSPSSASLHLQHRPPPLQTIMSAPNSSARNNIPPSIKPNHSPTFFKRRRSSRSESAPAPHPFRLVHFSARRYFSEPDLSRPIPQYPQVQPRRLFAHLDLPDPQSMATELEQLNKTVTEQRKAEFSKRWNFDIDQGPQLGPFEWDLI